MAITLQQSFYDPTQAPYSIKADGVTDDSTALQNAINDCIGAQGILLLPMASINIGSAGITLGSNIEFTGIRTVLIYSGTGDALAAGGIGSVISNLTLKGFTIQASGNALTGAAARGLHIYNAQGCTVCDVTATGFSAGEGVRLDGGAAGNTLCSGNEIKVATTGCLIGLHLAGANGLNGDRCNRNIIKGNFIGAGATTAGSIGVWVGDGHNNVLLDVDVESVQVAVKGDSRLNSIFGLRVDTVTNIFSLRADPNPGGVVALDHGANSWVIAGLRASTVTAPFAAGSSQSAFYAGQDLSGLVNPTSGVGTVAPQQAFTAGALSGFATEMAPPAAVTAVLASGGSLATVATFWKVTALDAVGETIASAEATLTPAGANLSAVISWQAVLGATAFKVYRSTTSGVYGATSLIGQTAAISLTDTGAALATGTPPLVTGAYSLKLAPGLAAWVNQAMGFGQETPTANVDVIGAVRLQAIANPAAAPLVSVQGAAGATTCSYTVEGLTAYGSTLPSAAATVATANATLSASNYNHITWFPMPGAVQYRIRRTAAGGTPSTLGAIATVAASVLALSDTGLAGDATTAPTSNTTGFIQIGVSNANNTLSLFAAAAAPSGSLYWGSNNLSPMTMLGDIMYGAATQAGGSPARLGANSTATKQYLQSVSNGVPAWAQVAFADLSGSASAAQMGNFTWQVTAGAGLSGGGTQSGSGQNVTLSNAGVTSFGAVTGGITLGAHLSMSGSQLVTDATNAPGAASELLSTDSLGRLLIGSSTSTSTVLEGRSSAAPTLNIGVLGNATGAVLAAPVGTLPTLPVGVMGIGITFNGYASWFSSNGGVAVYGVTSGTRAIIGDTTGGAEVFITSNCGVYGASATGFGVVGHISGSTGGGYAVYGVCDNTSSGATGGFFVNSATSTAGNPGTDTVGRGLKVREAIGAIANYDVLICKDTEVAGVVAVGGYIPVYINGTVYNVLLK